MKNSVTYVLWIVSILFILIFCSCGSRKVQKEQSKEETCTEQTDNSVTEKQTDINIKTETKTVVDDKNQTVTEETEYTPQDVSKESFVIEKDGTKVILNNVKKIVRHTTQKNNTSTTEKTEKKEAKKQAEKEKKAVKKTEQSIKETKSKAVEKEQFNPINYYIGFAIFITILVVAYFILKRLKVI